VQFVVKTALFFTWKLDRYAVRGRKLEGSSIIYSSMPQAKSSSIECWLFVGYSFDIR